MCPDFRMFTVAHDDDPVPGIPFFPYLPVYPLHPRTGEIPKLGSLQPKQTLLPGRDSVRTHDHRICRAGVLRVVQVLQAPGRQILSYLPVVYELAVGDNPFLWRVTGG
jgi:hypothetical protein